MTLSPPILVLPARPLLCRATAALALISFFLTSTAAFVGVGALTLLRHLGPEPGATLLGVCMGLLVALLIGSFALMAVRGLLLARAGCCVTVTASHLVVRHADLTRIVCTVPLEDLRGIHVADQFHPAVSFEVLLTDSRHRVHRVASGLSIQEASTCESFLIESLRPRA